MDSEHEIRISVLSVASETADDFVHNLNTHPKAATIELDNTFGPIYCPNVNFVEKAPPMPNESLS